MRSWPLSCWIVLRLHIMFNRKDRFVYMSQNKVDILGVAIDPVTMDEAVEKIEGFLKEDKVHAVFTPNSEFIMVARQNEAFRQVLNQGDLLVADGSGVILASRILGLQLRQRVPGIDLVKTLLKTRRDRPLRVFLFGSKPGIAEKAAENMLREFPGFEVAGCRNGFFQENDMNDILNEIRAARPDLLLVALGMFRQEKFIIDHRDVLNVPVCIGVGGSLDVFAGAVKRAPEFYQKHGLEWFYRLCKEPWRFKRMLALPKFVLVALAARLRGRR